MLDCLPSNEVQVKGCFWCGLQTRVLFCWSSPDLNPKQPDLSNALQTSILNTHLIFISGLNSSSGGCSKSLGPIIPNCRRRVSWKLVLSCEQEHQFFCHGGGKKFRACGFQQASHAVACMLQAHQSKAVACMFQAQSCSELKLHMLRLRLFAKIVCKQCICYLQM